MKDDFFTFRTDPEDRKNIQELARLLGRNKADAIRFAVARVTFEKTHPELELKKMRGEHENIPI